MNKELQIARAGMFFWMREATLEMLKRGQEGIEEWQRKMDKGLLAGYEIQGAPRNSGVEGFLKYVVERDRFLGLEAGGHVTNERNFSYWIIDPFIPLREEITQEEYEKISTHGYLATKIRYFLPGEWKTTLMKSPWLGDDRTEWIIERQ
ncbi:MAG: hypothetical protein HY831_04595 [Candidatus Aenigmarchaeota archaeon]|nr:hypothetical protein [Candidatus Aenigmarchaeota archaeon]